MTPSSRLIARRIAPLTTLAFLLALLFALAPDASAQRPLHPKELQARQAQREREERDEPLRREQWFYEPRTLPDGRVPANLRLDALRRMQDMMEAEGKLIRRRDSQGNVISEEFIITPSTTQWTPIGPRPGLAGGSVGSVSGRIGAIAVHPTNANTVFLGGAQGGIWRSLDGGMTWVPISDSQASLAIGAIAIDPTNPNIVYVGTGEQTFSVSSYYGAGILKSTNALDPDPANISWTQLGASVFAGPFSSGLGGSFISSIAINPSNSNLILAGVQINTGTNLPSTLAPGVFCSGDAGANWSIIPSASGAVATEVVFANSTTAYAGLGRIQGDPENGIYKSTNASAACSAIVFSRLTGTDAILSQGALGRIEIAVAPSATDTIYASVANAANTSSSLLGFLKSINGGTTWTRASTDAALPLGSPDFFNPQCWYDQVIKVHPNDAQVVYAGGSAVANFFMRSTNGGQSWTPFLAGTNGVRLHVDQHAIAFGPGSGTATKIYVGNDGGAWSSDVNNSTAALNWTNLNATLSLTQFYPGMSIHPSDDQLGFGGTQDNNTQRYTGSLIWQTVTCGDGGWTAIDPAVPTTVYATCQNVAIRKSVTGGTVGSFVAADNGITDTTVAFIPPFVIDPSTPQRLYFGTTRVWQTTDGAGSWSPISPNLAGSGSANVLTALAVSPASSSVVWASPRASGGSSRVFVATNVGPGTATFNIVSTGLPSRVVTQIVPDPADPATAYVTYSGFVFPSTPTGAHIFKTTNSGAAWSNISGDLPNVPVNDLVIDPDITPIGSSLYAATDVGVFVTSNAGLNWSTLSVGLPRVAVLSLKLARASRVLRAATHGRGAWDFQLDPAALPSLRITSLAPLSATAGGAAFTLTVNGAGFLATSEVRWNGSITGVTGTTCPSATQCTANIAASLIASGGTAQITVANGAATSNLLAFVTLNPAPTLTNVDGQNPLSIPADNVDPVSNRNITVNGTNFSSGAVLNWNLAATGITTSTVSPPNQITGTLSSSLLRFGGVNILTVVNPAPGGGISTNFVTVNVTAPPPANDNFAATLVSSNNFSNTVDNSAATTEAADPAPGCVIPGPGQNVRTKTVWYRFTPNGDGPVTADTIGSTYDTVLTVVTGGPGAFAEVACNDDISLGGNLQSSLTFTATAGTNYFFMISVFFDPAAPPFLTSGGKTVLNLTASLTIPPFFLSSQTAQQIVTAGQSAQYSITATPQPAGFSSAITFACTGLPTLSSCSFNPASVTPSANPASTTLTISTTARSAVPAPPQSPSRPWPLAAPWLLWFVAFALLGAALLAGRRFGIASRLPRRWRLAAAALPLILLVLLFVLQVSGCGGGSGNPPPPPPPPGGTPTGTYNVTVTGTSGANVRSTGVSLRVN